MHQLVINTHKRFNSFTRLLSHVKSYDYIFKRILIIVDSDIHYYKKIKKYVDAVSSGCNKKYYTKHLLNVGGAAARNYAINNIEDDIEFISFCDDDDLPFKLKYTNAIKFLKKNNFCIGYSCSYVRDYGIYTKKIIDEKKIYFHDILNNNDVGGFSFVTLKVQNLKGLKIPVILKSNQDWYLWISLLNINRKFYIYKDQKIGLLYNDIRNSGRLTTNKNNISSTYIFYKIIEEKFNLSLDSIINYYYYKILRQKSFFFLVRLIIVNNKTLKIPRKHINSLLKNHIYKLIPKF